MFSKLKKCTEFSFSLVYTLKLGKNVAYAMDFYFVIIQILNDVKERSEMIAW